MSIDPPDVYVGMSNSRHCNGLPSPIYQAYVNKLRTNHQPTFLNSNDSNAPYLSSVKRTIKPVELIAMSY